AASFRRRDVADLAGRVGGVHMMEAVLGRSIPVPWLFLLVSIVGAAFTLNALRPMGSRPRRSVLSFFAGWLTTELALHHLAWQVVFTLGFVWAGGLSGWPGFVALAI